MGPATTGSGKSFTKGLEMIGKYLDVATYHKYRLGDGGDSNLSKKAMQPLSFSRSESFDEAAFKTSSKLRNENAQVWIGEFNFLLIVFNVVCNIFRHRIKLFFLNQA